MPRWWDSRGSCEGRPRTEDDALESAAPRIQLSSGIKLRSRANRPLSHASLAYPGWRVRGSNFAVMSVPRCGGAGLIGVVCCWVGGFAVFTVAICRDGRIAGKIELRKEKRWSNLRARRQTQCSVRYSLARIGICDLRIDSLKIDFCEKIA